MKKSDFDKVYANYLQSEDWKDLRHLVLLRDNNVCQGCFKAPATEVHHKTYERVFREPMFDLISLCRDCHAGIHDKSSDIERAQPYIPMGMTLKTYNRKKKEVITASGPLSLEEKEGWEIADPIYHPNYGNGVVTDLKITDKMLVIYAFFEGNRSGKFLAQYTRLTSTKDEYEQQIEESLKVMSQMSESLGKE